MTETEWLTATNPSPLLEYLRGKASERKLRLFACACCRRLGLLLANEHVRNVVTVAEQSADGMVGPKERSIARRAVLSAAKRGSGTEADWAAYWAASGNAAESVEHVFEGAADAVAQAARAAARAAGTDQAAAWDEARLRATQEQADLLRHIIGNPFRAAPILSTPGGLIVRLAEALYEGEDCAFALHDALLETGHGKLAEHFATPGHPKGCWAIDLLRGKG